MRWQRRTFTRKTTSARTMYLPTCSTRSLREHNEFLFRFAKQKLAFFIWGGDQVIRADSLRDESVEEIAIVPIGEENAETAQRYRDVLKSCVIKRGEDASYVLLGIENQASVHYAMRVRFRERTSLPRLTCVNRSKLARLFVVSCATAQAEQGYADAG